LGARRRSRRCVAQRVLNRNVFNGKLTLAGIVGNASFKALRWAIANQEVIVAAARSFGSTYLAWLSPLLSVRSRSSTAESSGLGAHARGSSRRPRDLH
jgi:hypothetical protein